MENRPCGCIVEKICAVHHPDRLQRLEEALQTLLDQKEVLQGTHSEKTYLSNAWVYTPLGRAVAIATQVLTQAEATP